MAILADLLRTGRLLLKPHFKKSGKMKEFMGADLGGFLVDTMQGIPDGNGLVQVVE